ncbi:uncharacterized protein I303_102017 [Kwoniella dejecticola CBS 10117]|uniref:F-box domain-containing protein n=1 Tax=Kwoniella dejecticola CBS 10117 TaxID=1296121 RepID=A0A1A6AC46_9TREE|nr:uncharacterized protein I303_01845 [Kwoniella dejecticola CBS 10117]OBR87637.1 hypothetical protein I303_01845 [Kwoniella dejecticola CBS 10117]
MGDPKSMSSNEKPSLSSILPEILNDIISHLSDDLPSLSKWCRTSRQFYSVLSPIIWSHLDLQTSALTSGITIHAIHDSSQNQEDIDRSHTSDVRPVKHFPNPLLDGTDAQVSLRLAQHVERMSLVPHPSSWCKTSFNEPSSFFPNLRVLDLCLDNNRFHNDDPTPRGRPSEKAPCKLLRRMNPDRLIVRLRSDSGLNMNDDIIPQQIWKSPKRIIVVSRCLPSSITHFHPYHGSTTSLPNLRSLTFILQPSEITVETPRKPLVLILLSLLRDFKDINICIVGKLDQKSNTSPAADLRQLLSQEEQVSTVCLEMAKHLKQMGWNAEAILQIQGKLSFTPLREWVRDKKNWADVFPLKQIQDWVNTIDQNG